MIIYAITAGFLMMISVFLILKPVATYRLFGFISLSFTINLIIFICGRIQSDKPAFINTSAKLTSNPLSQALILTAIVISFGLLGFLCALLKKIIQAENND